MSYLVVSKISLEFESDKIHSRKKFFRYFSNSSFELLQEDKALKVDQKHERQRARRFKKYYVNMILGSFVHLLNGS